jgi:ATP-dependent Zn protease
LDLDEALFAYHEAGHAVMACHLGGRLLSVSIERNHLDLPRQAGLVTAEWPSANSSNQKSFAENCSRQIHVILAGPVAEAIYRGEPLHPSAVVEWQDDWQQALAQAELFEKSEPKRWKLLEQIYATLYRILQQDMHWQAISEVADQLLAHETIDGGEVHEIVSRWIE